MRKFLIFLSLWLGLEAGVWAADSFVLTSGASFSGDIVKFDDYDVMIHTTSDTYTNVAWPRFSQETLKLLSENPRLAPFASPFIEPTPAGVPPKPQVRVNPVVRMALPGHPSVVGGLVHSSLGLFLLFVVYVANLYAAYEVAVVRGKSVGAAMGTSAVLPIIGPVIFLLQPITQTSAVEEAPPEDLPPETAPAGAPPAAGAAEPAPAGAPAAQPHEDIQIVSASWQPAQEERKPQPQVFARGKFTLNKRFIETKFANYIGEPKGDAKNFTMEVKTLKDAIPVECIKQVGQMEAILETPTGQLTVPFADIMEIKLTPRPPAA